MRRTRYRSSTVIMHHDIIPRRHSSSPAIPLCPPLAFTTAAGLARASADRGEALANDDDELAYEADGSHGTNIIRDKLERDARGLDEIVVLLELV